MTSTAFNAGKLTGDLNNLRDATSTIKRLAEAKEFGALEILIPDLEKRVYALCDEVEPFLKMHGVPVVEKEETPKSIPEAQDEAGTDTKAAPPQG